MERKCKLNRKTKLIQKLISTTKVKLITSPVKKKNKLYYHTKPIPKNSCLSTCLHDMPLAPVLPSKPLLHRARGLRLFSRMFPYQPRGHWLVEGIWVVFLIPRS